MFRKAEIIFVIFIVEVLCFSVSAQELPKKGATPKPVYGLTIENLDSLNTTDFSDKFNDVLVPITLRIVFQRKTLPSDYKVNLETLHGLKDKDGNRRFYLMALLFDSEALKEYKL